MFDIPISKMNDKQLRNAVQLLYDELAMFKRMYKDAICNLDNDNFSAGIIREKEKMKAQISMTAEEIKTKVSIEYTEGMFSDVYSTISQTANAITSTVAKNARLDEAIETTSVGYMTDENSVYVIRDTDQNGNIANETYYYYSEITGKWEILTGNSIYSVFEQTASGFSLRGNVSISGELITTGTISADRISTDIAQVADELKIGDSSDEAAKYIIFSDGARLYTYNSGYGYHGMGISAAAIKIGGGDLDLSGCTGIIWGDNAPSAGTATVVFG